MATVRRVDIVLKATDEATKVFDNVANNTLPQFAKRVAQSLTAFASVAAVEEVVRRSISAALEAEKANAGLAAALNSQKISLQANLPHLTRYAEGLARMTAATDEEIKSAQRLLISIGGLTGDKLDQATKAVLNLAAGLGISLPEAAEKVARAANGAVRGFTQLGVKFQEDASDAQKFDTVLAFIDRRFGNAAQAQVETMAGKIGLLTKAWGELEEAIGKQALGSKSIPGPLGALTDAINVAAEGIDSGKIKETIQLFEGLADFNPQSMIQLFEKINRLKMDDTVMAALSGKFAQEADPVLQKYNEELDAIIKGQNDAADAAKRHAAALAKVIEEIESQVFGAQKKQPKTPITGTAEPHVLKEIVGEANFDQRQFDERAAAAEKEKQDWLDMIDIIAQAQGGVIAFGEQIKFVAKDTHDWAAEFQKDMAVNLAGAAAELGGILVDAAFGAKVSWGEAIASIIQGLIKAVVQAYILKIVTTALALSGGGIVPGGGSFASGGVTYAAGGWMRPRGTDTVPAMLTPGEMVLTRDQTQSILGGRAALVGPGGGGGGGPVSVTVYAMDSLSFDQYLSRNPRALANAIDHMQARGVLMAIWTLAPSIDDSPPEISFQGPPALVTKLSDGKEIGRRKHANAGQIWRETYKATGSEFDAALAIFATYGTDQVLTKKSYDLASAPTTEKNVCFDSFDLVRQGEDFFEFSVQWRLVY